MVSPFGWISIDIRTDRVYTCHPTLSVTSYKWKGKRTLDVSISEVTQFLRCRRQWDVSSPNRQALRRIALPRAVLNIGTLVHAGIAGYHMGRQPVEAMQDVYTSERDRFCVAYEQTVGAPPSAEELAEYTEQFQTALRVVERYFYKYGTPPMGDRHEVIAAEQTFRVPIPGTDGFLIGTFDQIVRQDTGRIFVGEIKTFQTKPSYESLLLRPQFTAYVWALQQLRGERVSGVLYDGVSRKLPKAPALLQRGGVSKAWSESLDYQTYYQTVMETHGSIAGYEDILERLIQRDQSPTENPFYVRHTILVSPAQVASFEEQLTRIYLDMGGNGLEPFVYPNFQTSCTWDCPITHLCSAMQHGEDADTLIANGFYKNDGSQSFRQRDGTEQEVDADYFTGVHA